MPFRYRWHSTDALAQFWDQQTLQASGGSMLMLAKVRLTSFLNNNQQSNILGFGTNTAFVRLGLVHNSVDNPKFAIRIKNGAGSQKAATKSIGVNSDVYGAFWIDWTNNEMVVQVSDGGVKSENVTAIDFTTQLPAAGAGDFHFLAGEQANKPFGTEGAAGEQVSDLYVMRFESSVTHLFSAIFDDWVACRGELPYALIGI